MGKSLEHIRVLDLTRILAGPFCTQMLGDLGANIIKIEKPGAGDDTRSWGPPFLKDKEGKDSSESAYYLSANRNKKSLAVDITTSEGQQIIHALLGQSDVLIENFKTGGLEKYGLSYEQLKDQYPKLIYCSITGFGHTGPLAQEAGYDFIAQGMAGLMACTGDPDKEPMKVGVALSDIITGLNAAVGILAALQHRERTGQGQFIDIALLDSTISALTNIAQYYLTSGKSAPRFGNAHSTIVPYQAFEAQDGFLIIAVGNDDQFRRLCKVMGHPEWAEDKRFVRNADRVVNRTALLPMISDVIATNTKRYWLEKIKKEGVPCGPVNTMDQVFAMEQIAARNMKIAMDHKLAPTSIPLVGNPLKMSGTPIAYTDAPPVLGQHTQDILLSLGVAQPDIDRLESAGIIQTTKL